MISPADEKALELLAQELFKTPFNDLADEIKREILDELRFRDRVGWRS